MLTGILLGVGYAFEAVSELWNVGPYGPVVSGLVIATWVLDMILNVPATVAIAGRLWWMGRGVASLTATRTNRYASSMYIVVESGAISAVTGTVAIAFFTWSNPASLTAFDVVCQLLVLIHLTFLLLAPLLVVVQVANRSISHSRL